MKRLSEYGFVSKSKSSRLGIVSEEESGSETPQDPLPDPNSVDAGADSQSGTAGSPQPPQLVQSPQLVRNDVGTYSSADLRKLSHSDSERLWVLRNAFRPDAAYKYPAKEEYGKKRSFQHVGLGSSLGYVTP